MVERTVKADTAETMARNTELAEIVPPPRIKVNGIRRGLIFLEACVGHARGMGDLCLDDGGVSRFIAIEAEPHCTYLFIQSHPLGKPHFPAW